MRGGRHLRDVGESVVHEARQLTHVRDAGSVPLRVVILLHLVVCAEPTAHRGE